MRYAPVMVALGMLAGGCMLDRNGLGSGGGQDATFVDRPAIEVGGLDRGGTAGGGAAGGGATGGGGVGGSAGGAAGSTGGTAGGTAGTGPDAAADSGPGGGGGAGGSVPDGGAGSGGTTDARADATTSVIGCADGVREGYLNLVTYPQIAACAGSWEIPGLLSSRSRQPQCDRQGGDDGAIPDGFGCSVADLCAAGWHVCETVNEVAQLAGDCRDATAPFGPMGAFFATRQRVTTDAGQCASSGGLGSDNIHGCGSIGSAEDRSCMPFMRNLRATDCATYPPWSCGSSFGEQTLEYELVTKRGPMRGGVLCCRD